jgi:hypothetical protein
MTRPHDRRQVEVSQDLLGGLAVERLHGGQGFRRRHHQLAGGPGRRVS